MLVPDSSEQGPVRGRTFDSEGGGGGWHFWSGQSIYFHHGLGRVKRDRIFIFNRNNFLKSKKKKMEGGGGSARVKKRGQNLAVHVLHNVLQTTCM